MTVHKPESLDWWSIIKEETIMLELLHNIKKLGNNHDETSYLELGVHNDLKWLYTLRQVP